MKVHLQPFAGQDHTRRLDRLGLKTGLIALDFKSGMVLWIHVA